MTFVIKLLINCIYLHKNFYGVLYFTVNRLGTLATATGLQDKFGEIIEYSQLPDDAEFLLESYK